MAHQQHYKTPFKKALLQFITEPDPFLAMLKWVMTEMMRIEVGPFLWIDALYQNVRVEGRVVSVAVMIARGLNKAGTREILTLDPMFDESEGSWRIFSGSSRPEV